jgi:ferredoxin
VKRVKVNDNCVACGVCFEITDLLVENEEGKAEPNPLVKVDESNIEKVEKAISVCPENCICIEEKRLIDKTGVEGILELKKLVEDIYNSYNGCIPPTEEYKFKKEDYSISFSTDVKGTRQYVYRSSEKADSAALNEFNRIMYSQKKALIQGLVVEYAAKKIRPYMIDSDKEGGFLYEANKRFNTVLNQIVTEAKELVDDKIDLSEAFGEFEILVEDTSLQEIKDIYHNLAGCFDYQIEKELDSLDGYDCYMTNDDKDEYNSKGNWVRSKYCYTGIGVIEACQSLAKDIVSETYYVVDDRDDGIHYYIKHYLRYCFRDMKDAMRKKFIELLNELDRFLPEDKRGYSLSGYSSEIDRDKMSDKSEGRLLYVYNEIMGIESGRVYEEKEAGNKEEGIGGLSRTMKEINFGAVAPSGINKK